MRIRVIHDPRKRKLTLPMMRRLYKELKIPMETLVGRE